MPENRYNAYLAIAEEHRAVLDRHIDAFEPEGGFDQHYYDVANRLRRTQRALDDLIVLAALLRTTSTSPLLRSICEGTR